MEIAVVVPTYNEIENLPNLVKALFALPLDLAMVVVDDGSPDGTGELADRIASENQRFRVIHRQGKQGLGTAYAAGFRMLLQEDRASLIAQMDADFSHDPASLPALVEAARLGRLAIGSRYVPGGGTVNWGLSRKLISRFGNVYARFMLGLPVADLTGGFKCWPKEVLASVDLAKVRSDGYGFQCETTYQALRAGHQVKEVPIIFHDRRVGQSKMTTGIAVEAMRNLAKIRFGL